MTAKARPKRSSRTEPGAAVVRIGSRASALALKQARLVQQALEQRGHVGEIVTFTYDFPKPGTKATALKETLEARIGKQACGVSYFKS